MNEVLDSIRRVNMGMLDDKIEEAKKTAQALVTEMGGRPYVNVYPDTLRYLLLHIKELEGETASIVKFIRAEEAREAWSNDDAGYKARILKSVADAIENRAHMVIPR